MTSNHSISKKAVNGFDASYNPLVMYLWFTWKCRVAADLPVRQDLRVEKFQIGLDGTIKTQTRIQSGGLCKQQTS